MDDVPDPSPRPIFCHAVSNNGHNRAHVGHDGMDKAFKTAKRSAMMIGFCHRPL